jgi:hypothetical protein
MSNFLLLADDANGAGAGAFFGGILALGVVFWIVLAVLSIFWIWMLIDVLTSNMDAGNKILWFLVVFFLHILGAIIYFCVARPSRTARVSGGTSLT